jgi:hypothetical protein
MKRQLGSRLAFESMKTNELRSNALFPLISSIHVISMLARVLGVSEQH